MIVKDILTDEQRKKYGLDSEAGSLDEVEIKTEPLSAAQSSLLDELLQEEDMDK